MTSPALAELPTDSIVDRFIALLSPFGSMGANEFLPIPGLKNHANEFKAAVEEARRLANELRRRRDPGAGDRLLGCLNAAVRLGALSLLEAEMPREILPAALLGPLSGLPDDEACGLFQRALGTEAEGVSLAAFTVDKLVDRFIEFCLRNFIAWNFFNLHDDQAQIDASNNVMTEIMRVLVALKERGALDRLLPLLKHENQNVRLWAADGVLFVDEETALATLTAIADEGTPESARMFVLKGPGLTNMSAMGALKQWRSERRGVYGLNPGDKPAY